MKHHPAFFAILGIGLITLACRPIIAIGWTELIIIIILVAVLLGPLLFRLYRFLDKVKKASQAEENSRKQG